MISVSFEMIFASVTFAAFLGATSGVVYALFQRLFTAVSKYTGRWFKKQLNDKDKRGILRNLFDCLFVLTVGLTYITSCYIFLDGVFDIYALTSLVLTFLLGNKALCLILNSNSST